MAYQETSKYCKHCARQVLARRKGANHIVHLILSILTGGIWAIIWLLDSIKIGGWHCGICGSKVR